MNTAGFNDWAASFVDSHDARVLLKMPGSLVCMVNTAFLHKFPTCCYPASMVATRESFETMISAAASRGARARAKADPDCSLRGELFALAGVSKRHFVFENLYEKLTQHSSRDWAKGYTFLHLRQDDARTYEIFGVHARLGINGYTDFLEARILPLGGVRIRIVNIGDDLPPKEVAASLLLPEMTRPSTIRHFRVPQEKAYLELDLLLQEGSHRLQLDHSLTKVRDAILDRLEKIEGFGFALGGGIIREIFGEGTKHSDPPQQRIADLRERLFDSVVLAEQICPLLEQALQIKRFPSPEEHHRRLEVKPEPARLSKTPSAVKTEDIRCKGYSAFARKFQANCEDQLRAFRHLLPKLRSTHAGQFVALHGKAVIDQDSDEFLLAERVSERSFDGPVVIQQISHASHYDYIEAPEEVFQ
jgi:hypothetical protein